MRTGDDVRVSTPITAASRVRNPFCLRPKSLKPSANRDDTNAGSQKCNGDDTNPAAYDDTGRS